MITIPHSRPEFDAQFSDAASDVIHSNFLTQGKATKQLEVLIQSQLEQRFALAVDSGTSALMLSIRHLTNHKAHARVGIPSYACASLLFAVKAAGAEPVLMDCNQYLCLDKTQAQETAKTLDVLVLVHPFGMVEPLAKEAFPCPVIEDIAQSVGATLDGKAIGTFADISIGSLYATKPWGGAYGGFITSNSQDCIRQITHMCNPDRADITLAYAGHHQLSNLHAAVAIQRILRATQEQKQRQLLARQYDSVLQTTAATIIHTQQGTIGNSYRYIIRTDRDAAAMIAKFQELGIAATLPVQTPLHHANNSAACPYADSVWNHCISLPMLPNMTAAEFNHMQEGIHLCLNS